MADVQQDAGVSPTPGVIGAITGDPVSRDMWLIVVAAVAYLVLVGAAFRAR